jgi:hypothetical protein
VSLDDFQKLTLQIAMRLSLPESRLRGQALPATMLFYATLRPDQWRRSYPSHAVAARLGRKDAGTITKAVNCIQADWGGISAYPKE